MRPPHTTGLFINDYHPVFRDFPTSYHSDLQWWELINKTPCIQFTEFPDDFQPLVQSIDTWFLSRKAGVLFEANVLNGKIIMTTLDLRSKPDERIVAHQLYNSILNYMNSDYFRPQFEIDSQLIQNLFIKKAGDIKVFTNDAPDEIQLEKNKTLVM